MENIDKKQFGSFIAEIRKEKGMTQQDLARKLNISAKAVSKWETGVSLPDINLLMPIAKVLDVSTAELLQGKHLPAQIEPVEMEKIVQKTIAISKIQRNLPIQSILKACGLILSTIVLYFIQFFAFPSCFPEIFPKSFPAALLYITSFVFLIFIGVFLISNSWIHWIISLILYAVLVLCYSGNGAYHIIPVLSSNHNSLTTILLTQEINKVTPFLISIFVFLIVLGLKFVSKLSKHSHAYLSYKIFLVFWNLLIFSIFGICTFYQLNIQLYLWIGIAVIGLIYVYSDGISFRTFEFKIGMDVSNELSEMNYDMDQRLKTSHNSSDLANLAIPLLICIVISILFL